MTDPLLSGLPTADEAPKARPVDKGELLRPGQDIAGRYEVRERLGRGGMGAVWRVYDRKLDEDVALKVILPDRMGDPTSLVRFRDEVKIARKITHSNVCRVFDIGESDSLVFLTMELIEGTTLRKLLTDGCIESGRAAHMLRQIIDGVAAAHERGIIHRDIKPENVLVRQDGRCLVADFGLAYRPDASTKEDTAGTPAYMSPEQLRGETLDVRSDVYALGLVAFELLTGQSPESARNAIAAGEPLAFDGFAEPMQSALRAVITRALAENPNDRFDSAAAFGAALPRTWESTKNRSVREARSQPEAFAPTEPVFKPKAAGIRRRRWFWVAAAPVMLFGTLMLLAQLPRGDIREWRPFSRDDDATEDNDTKNRIVPETRPTGDKAPLVVLPFENLVGEEKWNGLSRSAHASIRDALRTIPEIAVVDGDAESASSVVFRLRGSVQRTGDKPRLVVHIETVNATDDALRAEPVEVALEPDETAALSTLRLDTIEELKLLVRHWRKRQKATLGTKNDEARAKLLQYYAMVGPAPKRQHVEAGTALLDAALTLDATYLPALVERAYLRTVGGPGTFEARVAQSIVDLDAAKKIAPDDPDAAVMRCRLMQVATVAGARSTDKQIQDAREACQKALQLAPSSAFVFNAMARLSDLVCQDDEAIRLLEQSLDLDRGLRGRGLKHLVEFTLLHGQINVADRMSAALLALQEEEERLGPRAFSRRAGSPVRNAHWLRGVVYLRKGLAEEARHEFEQELASIPAAAADTYFEAATLRGLAKAESLRHKKLAPDLERRLAQLEAQFRSELATIPETALAVGDAYSRVDPEAAVEWLERTAAGSSCSDTVFRALVYLKAGKRDLARRTLEVCSPTQEWERSCMTEVRRLIGD